MSFKKDTKPQLELLKIYFWCFTFISIGQYLDSKVGERGRGEGGRGRRREREREREREERRERERVREPGLELGVPEAQQLLYISDRQSELLNELVNPVHKTGLNDLFMIESGLKFKSLIQ